MRPGQQQKNRMRGRGRKGPNPLSRSYESNGPDVKIRGTAQHVAEKYGMLARDAAASGDRVMAENYLQHAEHYNRIIMAAQAQFQPQRDDYAYDDEEGDDLPDNGFFQPVQAPRPAERQDYQPRGDYRGDNGGPSNYRDGQNRDNNRDNRDGQQRVDRGERRPYGDAPREGGNPGNNGERRDNNERRDRFQPNGTGPQPYVARETGAGAGGEEAAGQPPQGERRESRRERFNNRRERFNQQRFEEREQRAGQNPRGPQPAQGAPAGQGFEERAPVQANRGDNGNGNGFGERPAAVSHGAGEAEPASPARPAAVTPAPAPVAAPAARADEPAFAASRPSAEPAPFDAPRRDPEAAPGPLSVLDGGEAPPAPARRGRRVAKPVPEAGAPVEAAAPAPAPAAAQPAAGEAPVKRRPGRPRKKRPEDEAADDGDGGGLPDFLLASNG